jgi:hypothetical protein
VRGLKVLQSTTAPVEKIAIRRARIDDAERLWSWRNDPETRRASHNTEYIRTRSAYALVQELHVAEQQHLLIAKGMASRSGRSVSTSEPIPIWKSASISRRRLARKAWRCLLRRLAISF